MSTLDILATLAFLLVSLYVWLSRSSKSFSGAPPLPPGPTRLPIIGNLLDLRSNQLWLPAAKWAQKFGPITSLRLFSTNIIFVNSPDAATELLDRRGARYSGRPQSVMAGELCGCKNMLVYTTFNSRFRRLRSLMHKALSPSSVASYEPLLASGTRRFLVNLRDNPDKLFSHIQYYSGSIGLAVVYGHEPKSSADPFLLQLDDCLNIVTNEISSGGGVWLVDVFPILKHLPNWMPGAGFKRKAHVWKKKIDEFADHPFEAAKTNMKSGSFKPSFCSVLLQSDADAQPEHAENSKELYELDVKWAANSMFSSSVYVNLATITHIILALVSHPGAQKRAQEEIQALLGSERLPDIHDRARLPYVEALYKECLRWGAPIPHTLPRLVVEHDTYKGMSIPKGSYIYANIWTMLRDPHLYPSPESFLPERFLEKCSPEEQAERDPRRFVYGFGRRICPGIHLVESMIWLLLANMITVFDFSKPKDEFGNERNIDVEIVNSIFRIPAEFECSIKPRNEEAVALLKSLVV